MKRFFAFVLAAAIFASCDNSGSAAGDIKDSLDSVTKEKTESIDQAAEQAKDTIEAANDSLKNKVDSLSEKVTDSLKK